MTVRCRKCKRLFRIGMSEAHTVAKFAGKFRACVSWACADCGQGIVSSSSLEEDVKQPELDFSLKGGEKPMRGKRRGTAIDAAKTR